MAQPRINLNDKRSFGRRKVDTKFVLANIFRFAKPYAFLLAVVFILNVVSTLFTLAGPTLCGMAIDRIKPDGGTDFKQIGVYAGALTGVYMLSALFKYLSTIGMGYIARGMVKHMRDKVFAHLSSLPVSYFDKRQAGDIISVLSYDIDTVGESLTNDIIMVLNSAVLIIGSFVMMVIIAVPMVRDAPVVAAPLVLIFIVTIPLSAIVTRFIVRRVQPLFRKRSAKLGELNGFVEEMIAGQKTTKAYNCEERVIERFEEKNADATEAYTRAEYYGTVSGPFVNFINNISITMISVFGALMLMYAVGGSSAGAISSFVLYSRRFSGPINEIANILGEFQSALAAGERVFRVLEEKPEPPDAAGAVELENVKGDVDIENLSFGYVEGKPVIKDFSLSAKRGDVVAIVGHTGAGKTTIINLLMRFYDADSGTIRIDGKDIACVTRKSLRRAFTMVLQDTWLFAGTVYENIAYGNDNVTREDVERVCKAAKIHSFIMRLPRGYDTVLTDNAVNISKGQKQLLTIARAMLLDSPMLILDEATSNVDTRTEQIIQDAMRKLMEGRTCFVIAHRLSTIKHADKILVMRDGNVEEQGTHSELMARKGYYSRLYYSQFETY